MTGLAEQLFGFFNAGSMSESQNLAKAIVFGAACGVWYLVFLVLDLILVLYNRFAVTRAEGSLLGIPLRWREYSIALALGLFGASIVGTAGIVLGVLQFSIFASAATGIAWPFVLRKLVEQLRGKEIIEEDQLETEED